MKINQDKYKFYIFDMDLTLLDAREASKLSYIKAHNAVGDKFNEFDLLHFLTIPLPASYAEIKNPTESLEVYMKVFEEETQRTVFDFSKFYDDAIRCIKKLHNGGFKLGIVTNRSRECINGMLEHCPEIKSFFDVIVSNEDVKNTKPDPEPMFVALKRAGIDSKDAVYIGDAFNDYVSSTKANVDFICVNRYGQCNFEVENIIENLDDLIII